MRQSFAQGRAAWMDDFLNYAKTESPFAREMRNLTNQRNALAENLWTITQQAGASVSNATTGAIGRGDWAAARRQAEMDLGLNQTDLGRQALLNFIATLDQLEQALGDNANAALNAAAAAEMEARANKIAGLTDFKHSLALSGQSVLNPMAQLQEARRQYELMLALAQGGDQSALASVPESARALLDASRAVNASGSRYAADYAKVVADTDALITAISAQAVEMPVWVDEILERQDPWFADLTAATTEGFVDVTEALQPVLMASQTVQEAQLTVQQAGFTGVMAKLDEVNAELGRTRSMLKLALAEMAE